ncbi:uncharacterized protein LOC105906519 isoform X2 [Clupea harengus]|uniref:Uncharacterized protein LOC105906519 isoform X2 n=1 Tax=Clupea harengus TaxID=7950 RepID=A0A6P8FPV3_CLUHA|nr:uncharacterized protein LOC105906519 isoform X2 [Clupea harengus]
MTLFKSEHRSPRYMSMTGELKSSRSKTGGAKRPNSAMYGVYDYQRVPSSMPPMPHGSSLPKRSRSSSSSSSLRRSRDRPSSKSSRPHSSSRAKLKMEELQTIKRELTLIKVQIDGLLDNLDRMDKQRQDNTGSPPSREGSLEGSPYHVSASSPEASPRTPSPRRRVRRDSPELGEASDDEPNTMHHHSSDLEDEM